MNLIDQSISIPIIIGVSGHRDIGQHSKRKLCKKIEEVFIKIKNENPYSPIKLLTPLAEGADRIAAKVALENQIDLLVPLPMPIEEYKKDFLNDESRDEFEDLLSKASSFFEISEVVNIAYESTFEKIETRNYLYYQTGLYIAKNCQLLIALWDGKDTDSIGGTSSIVKYKLNNINDNLINIENLLDQMDSGPVYHIITPRNNENTSHEIIIDLKIYYPNYWKNNSEAEIFYRNILISIDTLNKQIYNSTNKIDKQRPNSIDLSNRSFILNNFEKNLLSRFKIIDSLAGNRKSNRTVVLRLILSMIVVAFFLFNVYLSFYSELILLAFYPALLGMASLIYFYAKYRGFEIKHEDYRALTEALRVQIFWSINDISQSTADFFLRNHRGELEWIKYALRNWTKPEFSNFKNSQTRDVNDKTEIKNLSYTYWIDSQRDWFYEQSRLNQTKHSKLKFIGNSLFAFGLISSLVLILSETFTYQLPAYYIISSIKEFILLFISLTLSCSAAFHGYAGKMVFSEQSKLYNRMYDLFKFASDRLYYINIKNSDIGLKKILFELGKESLQENSDWLLIHRSRPLEFPK